MVFSFVSHSQKEVVEVMGERLGRHTAFLAVFMLLIFSASVSVSYSETLQSSQAHTLLRIQYFLNFPGLVRNQTTDFCNLQPSSSLTVVCYDNSVTQLLINGKRKDVPRLPDNFSVDSFITTLIKLPDLKVLKLVSIGLWGPLPSKISRLSSLEILDLSSNCLSGDIPSQVSSLTQLQALILDDNMFSGRLPNGLTLLSVLTVLSVKNNSLTGPLPDSLGKLENLRVLSLSINNFSGEVPDLRDIENLQVLDLGNNSLGPRFPMVTSKIGRLVLRMNKFSYGIPEKLQSYYQLQHLDISSNRFVGPFPTFLLSLPSITYVNIASNRFTGMLFQDSACSSELKFVNLSSNLLTGTLPGCLRSKNTFVQYAGNCLVTGDPRSQHPMSSCQNEALAVGILPHSKRGKQASTEFLALSISGSVFGGILLVGVILILVRKFLAKEAPSKMPTRIIEEDASAGYTSKILSDARYITQAMKIGSHGLPPYRTFSLEELEEATNNFDTSSFMGEGTHGQMYRGQLRDGSFIAIRCLKLKRSHSAQSLMHHIEMMSKLRHQHLVSALGHCFEYYLDDSRVSRIFLIFEYVPYGNLRRWTSEKRSKRVLTWSQRISAAIGVAKGIQFLHTGIVPGIYANYVKITDVLLDQNLIAKISSYNLPLLSENLEKEGAQKITLGTSKEPKNARVKHREKFDIPDFGVILMEIISGKPMNSKNGILVLKDQLQLSITADAASRKRVVDPAISAACSDESLKTMIEICFRCLVTNPADRPSIDDVLWNLHFAAQVQDAASRGDSQSSDSSPVSAFQPPRLQLPLPRL